MQRNKIKKYSVLLLLIFIISGFFFSNLVFSQAPDQNKINLILAPPIFEPQLEKGETYTDKILLRNKNNFPIPVQSRLVNFDSSDEVGNISFQKGTGAEWFEIKEPNFILQANEERWINFKIKIPKDAQLGGYYVSWIFEPKIPPQYYKEGTTQTIPQLSALFLISVGKKGEVNFEIIEAKIPESARILFLENIAKKITGKKEDIFITKSANIPFVVRVRNNDIYHVKPSGSLELKILNTTIGKTEVKATTILPRKVRQISVNFQPSFYNTLDKYLPDSIAGFFSDNFYTGNYKAILSLHGSGVVLKEIPVFIFPLKGILITILLLLVLIFLIIINRKKIKRKIKKKVKKVILKEGNEPKKRLNGKKIIKKKIDL